MTSIASSISAFALAAATVTSVASTPQDACLAPLAKEWDKSATYLAARTTILGNLSVAFATSQGIAVVNSELKSVLFYDGMAGPLNADQISMIGTLEGHRPSRALNLTEAQRTLQAKIAACPK